MFLTRSLRFFPPVCNEARALLQAGWRMRIYTLPERGDDDAGDLEGAEVRSLHLLTRTLAPRRLLPLKYAELAARQLWAGRREPADLFIAHDLDALPQALWAARRHRAPVVLRAHELWTERAHVPARRLWKSLERKLLPRVDLLVAPTPERAAFLEQYGLAAPPLVVRNCPPLHTPVPGQALQELLARAGRPAQGRRLVLYQGTLAPSRCVLEVVAAAAHLPPEALLVLLGPVDVALRAPLQSALAAAEDRVVLLDPLSPEAVWPVLCSADVGLALYRPDCLNNRLCAPNKVFEYMAAGLPIVGAQGPGLQALVEGEGLGALVDPESPEDIARGIRSVLESPDREAMGRRGQALAAERYHWEAQVAPLLEAYAALVARRGARR